MRTMELTLTLKVVIQVNGTVYKADHSIDTHASREGVCADIREWEWLLLHEAEAGLAAYKQGEGAKTLLSGGHLAEEP